MLDCIYHMTLKLIKNRIFGVKTSRFCHILRSVLMDVISKVTKSVYRLYCMALYNSQTQHHVIKCFNHI